MLDLIEAVFARINASPDLIADLPGKMHLGKAPRGTPMPYCVLETIGSDPQFATGGDTAATTSLRLSFYGSKLTDLRPAVAKLKGAFDGQSFALPGGAGQVIGADLVDERAVFEEAGDDEPLSAWHHMLDFEFHLS